MGHVPRRAAQPRLPERAGTRAEHAHVRLTGGDVDQLAVPLEALDRSQLEAAGGKAVNLGELMQARLPVPFGFCLTTAAYGRAAVRAAIDELVDRVANAA